jgi:hypothetical protein
MLQAAATPPVLRPTFFAKQAQKREWKRTLKALQAENKSAQARREQRMKEAEADARKKAKVAAEDSRNPSFSDLLWPFTRTSLVVLPRAIEPRQADSKPSPSFARSVFSCFGFK